MKFGDIPLDDALGAILAHSVRHNGRTLKKGTVLGGEDIAALRETGLDTVVAAVLEKGDVGEDDAAAKLATAVAGNHVTVEDPFTGRVNLFAAGDGLFRVDRQKLAAFNRIDEAITLASLPPFAAVREGDMVATLKIIPFAVPTPVLDAASESIGGKAMLSVATYRPLKAALIQTVLPGTAEKVLDKTERVIGNRLAGIGGALTSMNHCPHSIADLTDQIRKSSNGVEVLFIAGASAITDRRDVIPSALEAAGGTVEHFGMPVDPGNLLMLGTLDGTPVIGMPGCARSPKLNGFDWVLQRVAAGLPVGRDEITAMGAGGLLKDIPSRPQPRLADVEDARDDIAAVLLAAGQSRRMGPENKLLIEIHGKPMIQHAAAAVREAGIGSLIVVTGHEAERVEQALSEYDATYIKNPDFADGLSSSLARGLTVVPKNAGAVLVCLGDMPRVTATHIQKLIAAWNPDVGREICVPTFKGKRGNPVLWSRRFIPEMKALAGDVGARHLIGEHADVVFEVEMDDDGIFLDVDVPEAVAALSRRP